MKLMLFLCLYAYPVGDGITPVQVGKAETLIKLPRHSSCQRSRKWRCGELNPTYGTTAGPLVATDADTEIALWICPALPSARYYDGRLLRLVIQHAILWLTVTSSKSPDQSGRCWRYMASPTLCNITKRCL